MQSPEQGQGEAQIKTLSGTHLGNKLLLNKSKERRDEPRPRGGWWCHQPQGLPESPSALASLEQVAQLLIGQPRGWVSVITRSPHAMFGASNYLRRNCLSSAGSCLHTSLIRQMPHSRAQEAAGKCAYSGRKADVLETQLPNSSRTNLPGLRARRNSKTFSLT